MLVICEKCGKNYRIDPEKVPGAEARFKCKDCGHQIIAVKPAGSKEQRSPSVQAPSLSVRLSSVRFGLTAKLFIMMIIISLVPLIMFWGIALQQTKNRIHSEAEKESNHRFRRIVRETDEWFYEHGRVLKLLAKTNDIFSMDPQKQGPLLNAFQQSHPEIDLIFTVDMKGKVVAATGTVPIKKHTNGKYFKDIVNGKTSSWQTWIDSSLKKAGLLLAVPIIRAGSVRGILATLMTTENIFRRILTFESGQPDFALLVRDKGRVSAHPKGNYIPQAKKLSWQPLITKFKSGKSGSTSFTDPKGNVIQGFVAKTAFGWGLAVQSKEEETRHLIAQVMSFAYLILMMTVAFVLIIAWFSARALSRPILKLTEAADRISVGQLDMEIRTGRKDEIGDLAEAIARMQESIRLSIERLRRRR